MSARFKDAEREQITGETRHQLLGAAAEEFAREGYAGANINRISRAAGFAKGTIYNYFPSKQGLMLALIDEVGAAHVAYIIEAVRQETDPRQRLHRFFQAGLEFVANHLSQGRVMVTTLYGPNQEFKEAMHHAYEPLFALLAAEIIVPGIAQGLFRPVDPQTMAGMVMTIYLGTGSMVNDEGQPQVHPTEVADFVWRALRREQGWQQAPEQVIGPSQAQLDQLEGNRN